MLRNYSGNDSGDNRRKGDSQIYKKFTSLLSQESSSECTDSSYETSDPNANVEAPEEYSYSSQSREETHIAMVISKGKSNTEIFIIFRS